MWLSLFSLVYLLFTFTQSHSLRDVPVCGEGIEKKPGFQGNWGQWEGLSALPGPSPGAGRRPGAGYLAPLTFSFPPSPVRLPLLRDRPRTIV